MKLKDRRLFPVINKIRDSLIDSDRDIGVLVNRSFFESLDREFSGDEVTYALRYLDGKDYFKLREVDRAGYVLTSKGYDEWLFPDGHIDPKKVFLSYAIADKKLAGKLKEGLEKEGLHVFLAHEDIEPTERWRDKIIADLKSSSTFIALRTKKYLGRPYTEQECGFTLALNKRILTISIDTNSDEMGFCSEFQGQSFKAGEEKEILEFCKKQLS
jgi:hypothetical protein